MRITVRHAICRSHLIDLFFETPPTLEDVVNRGAAMLAHRVRPSWHVAEPWPRACEYCGVTLTFGRRSGDGELHPVLSRLNGTIVEHK